MLNQYPLWKYLLLTVLLVLGIIYALPNIYGDDPALQITSTRMSQVDESTRDRVLKVLDDEKITYQSFKLLRNSFLVRFANTTDQLKAYDKVKAELGSSYIAALNLAPATPDWLKEMGALPMYLGLDLRGGVHFLLEVDMDAAATQAIARYVDDIRSTLRDKKVRYLTINDRNDQVEVRFR